MNLQEAKAVLNTGTRSELRDHAFGDVEIYWEKDGEEIGGGYFGGATGEIWVGESTFTSRADTDELRKCGSVGSIERNDETGPADFQEGRTMPGLTLEGVRKELTS